MSICDGPSVDEYLFLGATVYVTGHAKCWANRASAVLDVCCNALGNLGGITGNMELKGENFSSTVLVREIWKK